MTEPSPPNRKPWPMTWVVLAILAFMTLYTVVNVKFRKEDAAHLPYEEAQQRQSRFFDFDMNGWKWMTVDAVPASDLPPESPSTLLPARPLEDRLDRVLPMDLVAAIPKRPDLVPAVARVHVNPDTENGIVITVDPDPTRPDPIELEGFLKEGQLIVLATVGKENPSSHPHIPETPLTFRLTLKDAPIPTALTLSLHTETTVHEWTWK